MEEVRERSEVGMNCQDQVPHRCTADGAEYLTALGYTKQGQVGDARAVWRCGDHGVEQVLSNFG